MTIQDVIKPLPSPEQNWVHSVSSIQELSEALHDDKITAIETDIVMGYDITKTTTSTTNYERDDEKEDDLLQPIMAHPPCVESDLSFTRFFGMVTNSNGEPYSHCKQQHRQNSMPWIQKHLKLDIKDIKALDTILDSLGECIDSLNIKQELEDSDDHKTIYLNADIINGPGMRNDALPISADEFLKPCMKFLKMDKRRQHICALSLGWRTDCRSFTGYTVEDVASMKTLFDKYEIINFSQGIVLAVNARVLAKNPKSFDSILSEYPHLQLLIWTGTGEPPISESKINFIKHHFETNGCIGQIGFDCQIISSRFYDLIVETVAIFWNVQKFISQRFIS